MLFLLGVTKAPDMVLKGAGGMTILHHSGREVEPNQGTEFKVTVDAFDWVSKVKIIIIYYVLLN